MTSSAAMVLQAWMQRFWSDFTKKEFIFIKVLFFLIYGASLALFPFLTLQARSLGITEQELGMVYATIPFIAIIGPPLTGMIADKIGNFKVFMSLTMAASGCAALVFDAVPMAREHHALPDLLPFSVTCGGGGPRLALDEPHMCDYLPGLTSITLNVTSCAACTFNSGPGSQVQLVTTPCPGGPGGEGGCEGQLPPGVARQLLATINPGNTTTTTTTVEVVNWSCPDTGAETAYEVGSSSTTSSPSECLLQCVARVAREGVCSNDKTTIVYNPMLTFWVYLMVRVLNGLTLATSFTLFDGATMAVLEQHKGDYGLQRLYGNLGSIFATPISGLLIDYFSQLNGGIEDYRPAFVMYCIMKIMAAIFILFVNLEFRKGSNTVLKDFRVLIRKPEIVTFITVMLISGTIFGLLDTFLFWLLQDLGATKSLMGITVTVGMTAGIVTLILSGYIVKKLGHVNTIVFGFAFYVIRMLGYSFLTNPWWCMPFEALECFTVSLMQTAAIRYAADMSTTSTLATLQGVYGGVHHGVGRGLGSLLGGFLIGPLGIRNTFRLMAGICAVTCVTYFFINHFFFRELQKERKEAKKKKEAEEKEAEEGKKGPGEAKEVEEGKKDPEEAKDGVVALQTVENGEVLANGKERKIT